MNQTNTNVLMKTEQKMENRFLHEGFPLQRISSSHLQIIKCINIKLNEKPTYYDFPLFIWLVPVLLPSKF